MNENVKLTIKNLQNEVIKIQQKQCQLKKERNIYLDQIIDLYLNNFNYLDIHNLMQNMKLLDLSFEEILFKTFEFKKNTYAFNHIQWWIRDTLVKYNFINYDLGEITEKGLVCAQQKTCDICDQKYACIFITIGR